MKYLIIGAGGTGSAVGGFLHSNSSDVSFIVRGKNLDYLKNNGLKIKSGLKGDLELNDIKVFSSEEYNEKADVIFICVKSYSIDDAIDIAKKASHKNTIIIPLMNGYRMGERISKKINTAYVLDGCIYISAFIDSPGNAVQLGKLFKVAFGNRQGFSDHMDILTVIRDDLENCGIETILSENIEKETFKKFSFISAYATCGVYYDIGAYEMQKNNEYRDTFINLSNEITEIGNKLDIKFDFNLTEGNLKILDSLTPDTTASIQKDMVLGKKTEHEGLIFEIGRIADSLGLKLPIYSMIIKKLKENSKFI